MSAWQHLHFFSYFNIKYGVVVDYFKNIVTQAATQCFIINSKSFLSETIFATKMLMTNMTTTTMKAAIITGIAIEIILLLSRNYTKT